jgi:hypothetical protein
MFPILTVLDCTILLSYLRSRLELVTYVLFSFSSALSFCFLPSFSFLLSFCFLLSSSVLLPLLPLLHIFCQIIFALVFFVFPLLCLFRLGFF